MEQCNSDLPTLSERAKYSQMAICGVKCAVDTHRHWAHRAAAAAADDDDDDDDNKRDDDNVGDHVWEDWPIPCDSGNAVISLKYKFRRPGIKQTVFTTLGYCVIATPERFLWFLRRRSVAPRFTFTTATANSCISCHETKNDGFTFSSLCLRAC